MKDLTHYLFLTDTEYEEIQKAISYYAEDCVWNQPEYPKDKFDALDFLYKKHGWQF